MDTLTQRIISLRELKNISKAEMSRILDLDPSNYNKYEKIGRDWTINQIEKIAGALGVTVIELLTGEEKPTQNDERVRELEKRTKELEEIIGLLRSNLNFKEQESERLSKHFTNYLYKQIAIESFQKGYSKVTFYDGISHSKIFSGDLVTLIDKYKDSFLANFKKVTYEGSLKFYNPKEAESIAKQRVNELKSSIEESGQIYFLSFCEELAKSFNLETHQIYQEYSLVDELKEKAVDEYFKKYLRTGDSRLTTIMESGLISDSLLQTAYQLAHK